LCCKTVEEDVDVDVAEVDGVEDDVEDNSDDNDDVDDDNEEEDDDDAVVVDEAARFSFLVTTSESA
jgi:hypothetical protein